MASKMRNISEDEKMRVNYGEYMVKRKTDARTILTKLGIVLFAIALVILEIVLLIKVPMAMLPILVGTMALCWYLWRFTSIEYEYIIISATVELYMLYGEKIRKKLYEIKTADIEKVAPVNLHPEVKNADYVNVIDISDRRNGNDLFYILYNTEKGKGIIYFNAIKKTLDCFRYYRSTAVEYGDIK